MQLKFLFICTVVLGVAVAQRGHYAGNRRPILGSRYQNADTSYSRFDDSSNSLNTPKPTPQPTPQTTPQLQVQTGPNPNRFNSYPQQQSSSFNEGFQNQDFQYHGFPFNRPYNGPFAFYRR